MSSGTRRIKRASGELVAQIGDGTVDLFHGQPVAATGFGTDLRVFDGDGLIGLKSDEDVVLRDPRRDQWWLVLAPAMRRAYELAEREGRAIVIDNPKHVWAVALPADPAERGAALERLTTQPTIHKR